MHPLDGVRAKTARAREHLDTLNAEFDAFMTVDSETPRGVVFEMDVAAGKGEVKWAESATPPLRWSVILGEFLYCLRSALDHLAWQLVIASGGMPTNRTEFPVFMDQRGFESERALRKMGGMSDPVRAAIRTLQPWIEWPEHPEQTTLWQIHDLNVKDKHRLLHLTDLWMFTLQVRFLIPAPPEAIPAITGGPVPMPVLLERDTVLARFEWDAQTMAAFMETLGDQNVGIELAGSLDVGLAEGEWVLRTGEPMSGMQVRQVMTVGVDYVENTLVPNFTQFFDLPRHD